MSDKLTVRAENTATITSPEVNWWTTSGGSTFLPPGPPPSSETAHHSTTRGHSSRPTTSFTNSDDTQTVITSSIPVTTVSDPSTTFTSFSDSIITTSNRPTAIPESTTSAGSAMPSSSAFPASRTVCIGQGLDASVDGMLASIVIPSAIGLVLWLLFAVLRPRFRQVYGLREWFVTQDLRPKPLSSSLWAFLFPHVPLVPKVPSDVSDAGRSASEDAELFPSDEQLAQRVVWISFLICLGWTILGLGAGLPLYMVNLPCQADLPNQDVFGGASSIMQDMSLLRLLKYMDSQNVTTTTLLHSGTLVSRAASENNNAKNGKIRIIVLTILVILLGLLPAMHKIIKEFNALVAFRRRWIQTKCAGLEMGWLSIRKAKGFEGWGELRLKEYIAKVGLSSTFGNRSRNGNSHPMSRSTSRRRHGGGSEEQPLAPGTETGVEVDIQSLFTVGDTQRLAHLIDERDEILENLEIAETRYIHSFRITTPDPSIADPLDSELPQDPSRPEISRPLPLKNSTRRRRSRRRQGNPAQASSSLPPTSFVAPSQYYRLRGVKGVSGGRLEEPGSAEEPSFSDTINSRIVGSRFQEVNRDSTLYGRLPLGSQVHVDESGALGSASSPPPIPDPRRFGPNQVVEGDEWVDVSQGADSAEIASSDNGGPLIFRRQPLHPIPSGQRDTFPLRRPTDSSDPEGLPPPHLRLQPSQPFVKPIDGVSFDHLGEVYSDITLWRSRLKAINQEIADAQQDGYNDIAEGNNVKGWLIVGKGLRFIRGMELIEGRAKEDVRWDILQNERTLLDHITLWVVFAAVALLLAMGLTAAAGLALADAPDVAHFLPFLQPLWSTTPLVTGLATVFAPAVAMVVFISLALFIISWAGNIRGAVSVSGGHKLVFRATFWILTLIAGIFLIAVGALIYALRNFSTTLDESPNVANGSIYMSAIALALVLNVAIIMPALLLLQPMRLWHVIHAEKRAVTPRQRFRAVYPRPYNSSFATGACVLAIVFAATFSVIFPFIAPAVTILLFLTLVAHRFLVGYVYGRTHSQTGASLSIWLLRRFGTLVAFQPILLGLIFLSRRWWIEGGILVGTGGAVILFMEGYATWKMRLPGKKALTSEMRDSLNSFSQAASGSTHMKEKEGSFVNSPAAIRARSSMASVLEMMSVTLAVMPSSGGSRLPVPLHTETIDDLTATKRAARTHPDAPPRLPALRFGEGDETSSLLYPPELLAPDPIIWLPNDAAGVARSEALDLQRYHDLEVTLDVHSKDDVIQSRRSSTTP